MPATSIFEAAGTAPGSARDVRSRRVMVTASMVGQFEDLHGAQARRGLAFAPIKARHAEGGTRCPYYGSTPSVTSIGWLPSRWPGYVVRREASRWMPTGAGISSSSISICLESILDAIELTVEQNVLTIKAERRFEPEEGDELVISERPQGTFTRQLLVGESLDTDRLEADYDQGVLTLRIPVAEVAKPRRVEITKSAGGQRAIVEGQVARTS